MAQGCFLDHRHEPVSGFVDDPAALDAGPGRLRAVVHGDVVEPGAGVQDAPGVALGLQQAGHEGRGVDAEQRRAPVQLEIAVLEPAQSAADLAPPLGVGGLGVAVPPMSDLWRPTKTFHRPERA